MFGVNGQAHTETGAHRWRCHSLPCRSCWRHSAPDGVDLIRESVRMVLQELIEAEAAQVIGAARYERTSTRTTERNGGRERVLSTHAGDVSLRACHFLRVSHG